MQAQGTCKVKGRIYEWQVITHTTQFSALLTLGLAPIEVLRIRALEDSSFDIAIRIKEGNYVNSAGERLKLRYLGPVLVIGNGFPVRQRMVTPGILIRLRPRISWIGQKPLDSARVERIVQWCLSERFRAVRISSNGGVWIGHGSSSEE